MLPVTSSFSFENIPYLAPEIITQILTHCDDATLWIVATGGRKGYECARPVLFHTLVLKVDGIDKDASAEDIALHKAMLENSSITGPPIGHLVKSLDIQCRRTASDNHEVAHLISLLLGLGSQVQVQSHIHPTALAGIALLLGLVPQLQYLYLVELPQISFGADAASPTAVILDKLAAAFKKLDKLQTLQFVGKCDSDSSMWLGVILSSLPPGLPSLSLHFELHEDSESFLLSKFWAIISESGYRTPLQNLSFRYARNSPVGNDLLRCLLDASPLLSNLYVSSQSGESLSDATITELFKADRHHQTLALSTKRLPLLLECRHSLQQQTQLTSIAVNVSTHFLYYLPFLPPSMNRIVLHLRLGNFNDATHSPKLDIAEPK